jgi:hypothetical protein
MNEPTNHDETEAARGDDHSKTQDESDDSRSHADQAKQREREMEQSGEESPG